VSRTASQPPSPSFVLPYSAGPSSFPSSSRSRERSFFLELFLRFADVPVSAFPDSVPRRRGTRRRAIRWRFSLLSVFFPFWQRRRQRRRLLDSAVANEVDRRVRASGPAKKIPLPSPLLSRAARAFFYGRQRERCAKAFAFLRRLPVFSLFLRSNSQICSSGGSAGGRKYRGATRALVARARTMACLSF